MKSNLILYLFVALVIPVGSPVFAAENTIQNAGFVPANIWYSQDPFFDGDKVRIYTVIFNGSTEDIVGTAEFLDSGATIGSTDFSIAGGGRVRDMWVDWKATSGKHIITARLTNVSAVGKDGKKRPITLANAETGKNERIIDIDTDSDREGNIVDLDDDGDGLSDIDEVKAGTDPLKKDTDSDGTGDKEESILKESVRKEESVAVSESSGPIDTALKTIEEAIPEPIRETITSGAYIIEQFRTEEGDRFRIAKEEKKKEVDALSSRPWAPERIDDSSKQSESAIDSAVNTTEKPLAYVSLAVLASLQYLFEWKIVFYGVSAYVLYRLLRWIMGKVRNR